MEARKCDYKDTGYENQTSFERNEKVECDAVVSILELFITYLYICQLIPSWIKKLVLKNIFPKIFDLI